MSDIAKKTSPKAIWIIWAPVPLMLALSLSTLWFRRWFCDPSTLVVGHLAGFGIGVGAVGAGIGLTAIAVGTATEQNEKLPEIRRRNGPRIRRVGSIVMILSLAVWADSAFSYYCAGPDAIIVRPDPFLSPVRYGWNEVRQVRVGCYHSRGGMSIGFDLTMKDGRSVELGGDAWSQASKTYGRIGKLLSLSPYEFDNQNAARCPAKFKAFFATRP